MSEPQHVLVVGASSGIGKALAERLAPKTRVTAFARRADRLEQLTALGVRVARCDVTEAEQLTRCIDEAVATTGRLSCIIYCAGLQKIKPIRMLKAAEISELIKVNFEAPAVLGALFASRRISTDDAVFCAVSSIAASRPEAGIVVYSAAKAALEALIKGLAREVAPRRAVGVAPGWLDTEMTRAYANVYNDEFRRHLAKTAPRGIATVDAVADCIEFLISPAAGFITGEIVRVDGGAAL